MLSALDLALHKKWLHHTIFVTISVCPIEQHLVVRRHIASSVTKLLVLPVKCDVAETTTAVTLVLLLCEHIFFSYCAKTLQKNPKPDNNNSKNSRKTFQIWPKCEQVGKRRSMNK